MKRNEQHGFTLIEVMMVVTIVGILMAIAIPQYQRYSIRAKVSEGLALLKAPKTATAEYFNINQVLPTSNASAGLAAPNDITSGYVKSIEITASGSIVVTYHNLGLAGTPTLELTPTSNGSAITWTCTGGDLEPYYRPANCR